MKLKISVASTIINCKSNDESSGGKKGKSVFYALIKIIPKNKVT
jgi:hypothetical protein